MICIHYYICFNGPYFKEYINNIRELCKQDIDRIFLDVSIIRIDTCYCEYCFKTFLKNMSKVKSAKILRNKEQLFF